ncbi:universal stress protein [Nocardioides jensenii]|uniref:universal stress protein n=1 Tax=Nocardioides jensenii TaxID=1843 RepID=UPI00082B8A2E|nr:universal stress protein [Nocardioides jensenii]
MTKTIVTGVDESETAAAAATKAAELAQLMGASLHVLSAYGEFESERISLGNEQILVSNEQLAQKGVEDLVFGLRKRFPDLEITLQVMEGRPGDALVKAAETLGAELIVVGNKRVQGVARVLGSIARDVAAHAPCDLYVVNTHQRR